MMIFIVIILAVLSLIHFVVYEAFVVALGSMPWFSGELMSLRGIFIVLTFSFIVASLMAHKYNTKITRGIYLVSALWLGVLTYLFFVSIVYIAYSSVVGPSPLLATILFLAVLALGIYGYIRAQKLVIVRLDLTLVALPSFWKNKKVVFLSDLHLGQIYGRAFTQKIVDVIRKIEPEMVLLGGDIYDGSAVDVDDVMAPFGELTIPQGIYAVPGNHEEFTSSTTYFEALRQVGIEMLMDRKVTIQGLDLVGVDYRTTNAAADFEKVLRSLPLDPHIPRILLKHVPHHLHIAERHSFDLHLSGHTHKAQMFPFNIFTHFIYKGYDYGLKSYKDMQVYTSSGAGTWGPPLRIGSQSEIVVFEFK